ncbi:MAG: FecR domain-containing protein [Kiritimatiellae bacterium]|nr:FecR domain-containing protein [Kiritimatiellia bacterium]MDD5521799.1 FecR domain-containing protein [Kiritimatiellia bacterium]
MRGYFLALLSMCVMLGASVAQAVEIGKVEKFEGIARILSGDKVTDIKAVGQPVLSGDKIQTEQGSVEIKLNDGAEIKVKPFSVVSTVEKQEKKGVFFKTTEDARRVTAHVGKAYFKSAGPSGTKKNYLQTPTAVCALRGSSADFGANNSQSFLHMYTGNSSTRGNFRSGNVPDSNSAIASVNAVFSAIDAAVRAASRGMLAAQRAAYAAQKAAAESLLGNPDGKAREMAKVEAALAVVQIAVTDMKIAVEAAQRAVAAAQAALAAAQQGGNAAAIAQAQAALNRATAALAAIQQTLAQMETILQQALQAAAADDVNGVVGAVEQLNNVLNNMNTQLNNTGANLVRDLPPPVVMEQIRPLPAIGYENQ